MNEEIETRHVFPDIFTLYRLASNTRFDDSQKMKDPSLKQLLIGTYTRSTISQDRLSSYTIIFTEEVHLQRTQLDTILTSFVNDSQRAINRSR